jgi:anti-sigma regulatory factor (Ser/Thr protein kinase)
VGAPRTVGAHRRLFHGRPRTGAATTDEPRTRSARSPLRRLDVHGGAERACPCVRPLPGWFPGVGRLGKGGAVMAMVAVRESVTLAGRAERARAARGFVSEILGPGHPCGDVAVLLVSEVFSNSVRHSDSGAPGETVTVVVIAGDGIVRVEVTDRAGPGMPELRPVGRDAEGGRGLRLVAGLAARWGWRRRGGRMVTWFELQALLQPMQHSACPVARRRIQRPTRARALSSHPRTRPAAPFGREQGRVGSSYRGAWRVSLACRTR